MRKGRRKKERRERDEKSERLKGLGEEGEKLRMGMDRERVDEGGIGGKGRQEVMEKGGEDRK